MLKRADELGHTAAEHYLWCASQHHHHDPTKPAKKWDGAWRSLRAQPASPLPKKMLEHYSHQRLKAKGQMLARMEVRRKKGTA